MRTDDQRLGDIRRAAQAALRFADGKSRDELVGDDLLIAALLHEITVIGEAASNLSAERRARIPGVPWREVTGMRQVIVHAYWRVDIDELWQAVCGDLPNLLVHLPDGPPEGTD
ncbi:MAG: DUF86 domain-containing protein [Chloroflexi bacterium]|nr:DUF86 domain-containing protein [Chloroflexota bacterium]